VTGEVLALTLTVVVHIIGAAGLVAVIVRNEEVDWRSWWPRDDDGPAGPEAPEPPPAGGDRLPLPGAAPSGVRLREPGRLADGYPRPSRRPAHAPEPEREPA
jgi:hypothetical protein